MTPELRKLEEKWVVAIAILAAMLLASHQISQNTEFGLITNYIYWFFRILIQAGIFIAVLIAVERYLGSMLPDWGCMLLAMLLSLIPYGLTITAFDLIIGLPEIGLNSGSSSQTSTAQAFAYELIYLFDNHMVVCLMLLLPRLIYRQQQYLPNQSSVSEEAVDTGVIDSSNAFVQTLDPPITGDLLSVEAQEHYVQINSSGESRMVLYRFSDAVRQLPDSLGMQVHRSHWVAYAAVKEIVMQGQTMKLAMHDGRFVPVSRTFRSAVESRFVQQ